MSDHMLLLDHATFHAVNVKCEHRLGQPHCDHTGASAVRGLQGLVCTRDGTMARSMRKITHTHPKEGENKVD
jgi:hypothetical protein